MFKEIVTKTIIGKGKKVNSNEFSMIPEETPNTVLGCWIINHAFKGYNNNGVVKVNGSFDVNVWYSYNSDTKTSVSTQKFLYEDNMNITLKDNNVLTDKSEIIVRSLKQPSVTNVKVENGNIYLTIEHELGVEIVGDTKLKINVLDDEDDYEDLNDEVSSENINENYINE